MNKRKSVRIRIPKMILMVAAVVMLVIGTAGCAGCNREAGVTPTVVPAGTQKPEEITKTPTPAPIPTDIPEIIPTESVTVTEAPMTTPTMTVVTATPEPTVTTTPTAAPTATTEPTATATPVPTNTPTPTAVTTNTPTPMPTSTPKPTAKPTATATPAPTSTPTPTPVKGIVAGDYVTFGTYPQNEIPEDELTGEILWAEYEVIEEEFDGNRSMSKAVVNEENYWKRYDLFFALFGGSTTRYFTEAPIEWLVLEVKDGKALLLSKYILDEKEYDSNYDYVRSQTDPDYGKNYEVTWETSTLRPWLNNEFLNTAFTEKEQESILLTKVDNPGNKYGDKYAVFEEYLPESGYGKEVDFDKRDEYGFFIDEVYIYADYIADYGLDEKFLEFCEDCEGRYYGGNDTLDKVYLLSESEAFHYFTENVLYDWFRGSNEECPEMTGYLGVLTDYARAINSEEGWWLRTRGTECLLAFSGEEDVYEEVDAVTVGSGAYNWQSDNEQCHDCVATSCGVRPVVWIDVTTADVEKVN